MHLPKPILHRLLMSQNHLSNHCCQQDTQQTEELQNAIKTAALKLYLAELRRISALINLNFFIMKAIGGRCFLERAGHPPLRIMKPARCCNPWVSLLISSRGLRRRIRLGPQSVEGLGEGTYFITGTDGGRIVIEVPKYPGQPTCPHPPAASAGTLPKSGNDYIAV